MSAATSQPSAPITLTTAYSGKVSGGWVGYDYVGNKIGSDSLTPTSAFTSIKSSGTLSNGSVTLSANAAADTNNTASLTVGTTGVVRNNFTIVGVFQVRAVSGAGVGVRSNSDSILFWRNSGNYNVRVNGVTLSGGVMPLNTILNYCLTSNASGIWLYVNNTLILSGTASVATATGVGVEVFEDSRAGGAMDLDVAMFAVLNTGVSQAEAQSLSNNPWQMFEVGGNNLTSTVSGTGGISFNGMISGTRGKGVVSSGGTLLAGTATVQKTISRAFSGFGGMVFRGLSTTGRTVSRAASGGFSLSPLGIISTDGAVVIEWLGALNDAIVQSLRFSGLSGAISDMYNKSKYWRTVSGDSTRTVDDVKKAYLKSQGLNGQVNDMEKQYWKNK